MQTILKFIQTAINILDNSSNYGEDFVRLKMEFFRKHQDGLIFSTTFGAEFFHELYKLIYNGKLIDPKGEYDKNINLFLKRYYSTKSV